MGKLIVLEGGDGAGKSTQIELIKQYLENSRKTYKFLHFPKYGDNEFSEVISKFLRGEFGDSDKVNPYFVANIFAMDQFLFKPKLEQYLDEYDVVLLDRYVFSNMAYQAAKYEKESKESNNIINWINEFQYQFLSMPYPDLTLYLDVPLDVTAERLTTRAQNEDRDYLKGKKDIHEADLELQERVHYNYKYLVDEFMDCHSVKCAGLSGDLGGTYWFLYSPDHIFESYKQLIIETLNNG